MHQLPGIPFGTAATPAFVVLAIVALCVTVAAADPGDADLDATTDQLWSAVYGLASLTFQNRIKGGRRRAGAVLVPLVARFVAPTGLGVALDELLAAPGRGPHGRLLAWGDAFSRRRP